MHKYTKCHNFCGIILTLIYQVSLSISKIKIDSILASIYCLPIDSNALPSYIIMVLAIAFFSNFTRLNRLSRKKERYSKKQKKMFSVWHETLQLRLMRNIWLNIRNIFKVERRRTNMRMCVSLQVVLFYFTWFDKL